jgi:ABC-type multidrug transport system ATPase subunit
MPLIKLTNVRKNYLNQTFDLEIDKHDFILLSGENGNGKTTLIQLLLGFIYPDVGHIETTKLKIGYLPEKAMLPLFVKVMVYLETLARIKKSKLDLDFLHQLKIPITKSIHELSKGNQQKLAIFSTFMGNPDLVILDEPLSGLDHESADFFSDYLIKQKNRGLGLLISTHQPDRYTHLCTKHIKL